MNFLFDIFKKDPDKSFIVNYAPIFANLSLFDKNFIMQKSKVVEFNKGDTVYKQFDPPDAFYCVITGRIRIYATFGTRQETLEYLNCGKYFGMISVLTGDPHSVSAEAVNDSKILRITKEDFQEILNKIPKLAIDLSRTLSRRLRKKDLKDKRIFESNIISVFSANRGTGRTVYAANLAFSLSKETSRSVILVSVSNSAEELCRVLGFSSSYSTNFIKLNVSLPSEGLIKNAIVEDSSLGMSILNVMYEEGGITSGASLNTLLTHLTGSYHYIIVDLSISMDVGVFQVLNQSDSIHLISDYNADNLKSASLLISDLFEKVNYPQEKIKVIMNASSKVENFTYDELFKILNYKIYATLVDFEEPKQKHSGSPGRIVMETPELEYSKAIRRIAREIGDVRIGLALGGGAAFGLAHIGVIKALEKEKITIDMASGSSMGALIGALWASGLSGKQIEGIMLEYDNNKRKVFSLMADFCFPKLSIAKGQRIRAFLTKHLGDKTFQDIKFPFKIVASNLSKRQELVFNSGRLIDAVMASIAIPGVFTPTKINEDVIIDGGIIEPVPIGTLVKAGIKKIIAVNVLPSAENVAKNYEIKRTYLEEEMKKVSKKGFLSRFFYNLSMRFNKAFSPNIIDIIVNSIQTMEYVIAESDCRKADVLISPIVPSVDWFEFFKVSVLVKKGQEDTENAIGSIRSIINE